jgi:hypothetical protein
MPAPLLGVSFSHRHAAWLGLDPEETLAFLLADIGVRRLRLSAHWDELAPDPRRLDFAPLRPWLDAAARHDARVLMTVGLKAQRHPEFYPPAWLEAGQPLPHGAELARYPRVVARLLLMLERLTAYLADVDVIEAWQVENEPFVPAAGRTRGWRIAPGLLAREIEVVREADPRRRPIVVNHSSTWAFDRRWSAALAMADVLGQDVYTRRPAPWGPWRYWNVHALGPLAPALRRQARLARRLGKRFWITELQAEPWEREEVTAIAPARIGSISPARLWANLRLAEGTGAERVYLWGAEWWRFMAVRHGDPRYVALARELFGGVAARPAP